MQVTKCFPDWLQLFSTRIVTGVRGMGNRSERPSGDAIVPQSTSRKELRCSTAPLSSRASSDPMFGATNVPVLVSLRIAPLRGGHVPCGV